MGKLYIVATPIGNLEDITLRALKVLRGSKIILAEDTRSTLNLLKHHQIPPSGKKIVSFFEGNEQEKIDQVLSNLVAGEDISLVSESGTPLISDPGFKLVREVVKRGLPVESVPGPTALISALVISSFPTNAFVFLGFPSKKEGKVRKLFEETRTALVTLEPIKTVIFYESPHRLIKTLTILQEIFGDINIVVARELTKLYEEVKRDKISTILEDFNQEKPRGEFTVLFSPLISN